MQAVCWAARFHIPRCGQGWRLGNEWFFERTLHRIGFGVFGGGFGVVFKPYRLRNLDIQGLNMTKSRMLVNPIGFIALSTLPPLPGLVKICAIVRFLRSGPTSPMSIPSAATNGAGSRSMLPLTVCHRALLRIASGLIPAAPAPCERHTLALRQPTCAIAPLAQTPAQLPRQTTYAELPAPSWKSSHCLALAIHERKN